MLTREGALRTAAEMATDMPASASMSPSVILKQSQSRVCPCEAEQHARWNKQRPSPHAFGRHRGDEVWVWYSNDASNAYETFKAIKAAARAGRAQVGCISLGPSEIPLREESLPTPAVLYEVEPA